MVWLRASNAVSAVKSGRTCASSRIEVPISMMLRVSTTCCRLPEALAGTLLTSLRIDLPTGQRRRPLHRLGGTMVGRSNTIMVFENPVNRFLRGNWPLKELQGGISLQVILDRLSSWDATQSLGRLIANVQDALNHQGMNPGRGMDAGPGMPLQD